MPSGWGWKFWECVAENSKHRPGKRFARDLTKGLEKINSRWTPVHKHIHTHKQWGWNRNVNFTGTRIWHRKRFSQLWPSARRLLLNYWQHCQAWQPFLHLLVPTPACKYLSYLWYWECDYVIRISGSSGKETRGVYKFWKSIKINGCVCVRVLCVFV